MLLRICWLFRIHWLFRLRRAGGFRVERLSLLARSGTLLCGLLGSDAALAYGLDTSYEDLHMGLMAGVATACGVACGRRLGGYPQRHVRRGAGLHAA